MQATVAHNLAGREPGSTRKMGPGHFAGKESSERLRHHFQRDKLAADPNVSRVPT